jgi:hypothetical protein
MPCPYFFDSALRGWRSFDARDMLCWELFFGIGFISRQGAKAMSSLQRKHRFFGKGASKFFFIRILPRILPGRRTTAF